MSTWAYCSDVHFQFVTTVCPLIENSIAEIMNDARVHMFIWMRRCIIQNCDTIHEDEICSSARHFMGFVMKSINYKTIRMLSAVNLHDFYLFFFWTVQVNRISEGWRTEVRNAAPETRNATKQKMSMKASQLIVGHCLW